MDYNLPNRIEDSNKSTYGRVVNIAGSDYMMGAAYLSSVSPLKVGCGYCFLVSTDRVIQSVGSQTSNVVFAPYSKLKDLLKSADVVEIGCGLSTEKKAKKIFDLVIKEIPEGTPLVIDADGLNLLAKDGAKYLKRGLTNAVLTPHPKEASRLLGVTLEEVLSDVALAASNICEKYNCITVLKTHNTVVVNPQGNIYVNQTGNNSMAKAGSGDVLTGMISGLIAQGKNPLEASVLGVYMHGLCGNIASKKLTQYSVMAQDLIDCIPVAISFMTDVKNKN